MDIQNIPWVTALLGAVAGYIGHFFISYAQTKGKNFATKEDFNELLEQIRQTTRETESIKQAITTESWRRNKRWELTERYYTELLESLTKLQTTLSERADYFVHPGSEHREDLAENEHYQTQAYLGNEAYARIELIRGPAALVVSEAAQTALEDLSRNYWHIEQDAMCQADFVNDAFKLVSETFTRILEEARRDIVGENTVPSGA